MPVGNLCLVGRPVRVLASLDQAGAGGVPAAPGATSPVALTRTAFQDLKRLTLLLAYGIEDSP